MNTAVHRKTAMSRWPFRHASPFPSAGDEETLAWARSLKDTAVPGFTPAPTAPIPVLSDAQRALLEQRAVRVRKPGLAGLRRVREGLMNLDAAGAHPFETPAARPEPKRAPEAPRLCPLPDAPPRQPRQPREWLLARIAVLAYPDPGAGATFGSYRAVMAACDALTGTSSPQAWSCEITDGRTAR